MYTIQQLGLGITKAYSIHLRNTLDGLKTAELHFPQTARPTLEVERKIMLKLSCNFALAEATQSTIISDSRKKNLNLDVGVDSFVPRLVHKIFGRTE